MAEAMNTAWSGELGTTESAVEEVLSGALGHGCMGKDPGEEVRRVRFIVKEILTQEDE